MKGATSLLLGKEDIAARVVGHELLGVVAHINFPHENTGAGAIRRREDPKARAFKFFAIAAAGRQAREAELAGIGIPCHSRNSQRLARTKLPKLGHDFSRSSTAAVFH